jgi:hypothetical protein
VVSLRSMTGTHRQREGGRGSAYTLSLCCIGECSEHVGRLQAHTHTLSLSLSLRQCLCWVLKSEGPCICGCVCARVYGRVWVCGRAGGRVRGSGLFALASHNKKRPDNLILGRFFNHALLDMSEVGIDAYTPMAAFKVRGQPRVSVCRCLCAPLHVSVCVLFCMCICVSLTGDAGRFRVPNWRERRGAGPVCTRSGAQDDDRGQARGAVCWAGVGEQRRTQAAA